MLCRGRCIVFRVPYGLKKKGTLISFCVVRLSVYLSRDFISETLGDVELKFKTYYVYLDSEKIIFLHLVKKKI